MKKENFTRIAILLLLLSCMSSLISVAKGGIFKPSIPQFSLQKVDDGVQVAIQNQEVFRYNASDYSHIFYNIRIKSHDLENWVSLLGSLPENGTSGFTVTYKDFNSISAMLGLPYGSHQIDYQVEAIYGYWNTTSFQYSDPNRWTVAVVNTSNWSDKQTITIPATPSPEIVAIIGTVIVVLLVGAGLLVYFKKRKRQTQ